MASISSYLTPKGKKRYLAQINSKGHRQSKSFTTRRDAAKWVLEKEQAGQPIKSEITVAQMLKRYQAEVTPRKKSSHPEGKRINFFLKEWPEFCALKINEVTNTDIVKWRDARAKQVAPATILRDWVILSNAYNIAIREWEWTETNPFSKVPKPSAPPPRDRLITQAEIDLINEFSGYNINDNISSIAHRTMAAFNFSLETAMRGGEICALTEDDIEGKVAHVRTSKTRSGVRTVPLSTTALRIVDQMRRAPKRNDTLFGISKRQADANFRKYRQKVGNPDYTFHDARATAITRLAKKLDILDLARMVGHKDLSMLMVYYRQTAEQLADKLD